MKRMPYHSEFTAVAVEAARHAGEVLRMGINSSISITPKSSPYDVVTNCDCAAEETILSYIKSHYPSHAFLAEESGATPQANASVCWVIDPLDGTLNFAHRLPSFCVSIGVLVNSQVEVGVIYQPMLNELFVAERGHGAYLNGKRLAVSDESDLRMAFVSTGYPYELMDARGQSPRQPGMIPTVGNPIRIIGSAALSLAYVAAGRFDAFWGVNLNPWDVAAGILLVEEAGGITGHFDGSTHNIFKQANIIASNTHLSQPLLSYLKQ